MYCSLDDGTPSDLPPTSPDPTEPIEGKDVQVRHPSSRERASQDKQNSLSNIELLEVTGRHAVREPNVIQVPDKKGFLMEKNPPSLISSVTVTVETHVGGLEDQRAKNKITRR